MCDDVWMSALKELITDVQLQPRIRLHSEE